MVTNLRKLIDRGSSQYDCGICNVYNDLNHPTGGAGVSLQKFEIYFSIGTGAVDFEIR